MPAKRSPRDARRRALGQNFLHAEVADRIVASAAVQPGELVVDIGAGRGALTLPLARRGAEVVAVELDPNWAEQLRARAEAGGLDVRVLETDFLSFWLPRRPFRVVACPPFGETTAILRRLLDCPDVPLVRADLVLQWDVARKRASAPPSTLLSTTWAPWWDFELAERIPARAFRPVPRVDAGVLVVRRREPPVLTPSMASQFAHFLREGWPWRP